MRQLPLKLAKATSFCSRGRWSRVQSLAAYGDLRIGTAGPQVQDARHGRNRHGWHKIFYNGLSTILVPVTIRASAFNHQDIKAFYICHGPAGDPLKVTVEAGG